MSDLSAGVEAPAHALLEDATCGLAGGPNPGSTIRSNAVITPTAKTRPLPVSLQRWLVAVVWFSAEPSELHGHGVFRFRPRRPTGITECLRLC